MSESDLRRDCEKQPKKVVRKSRRDAKLQELEKQLEFAESRCGTLKQQLDYIKMLYKRTTDANLEKQFSKAVEQLGESAQYNCNNLQIWKNLAEQNENSMNDDGDGSTLIKQTSHSTTMTTVSSNKFNRREISEMKKKTPKSGSKLLKTKKKSCRKVKKRRRSDSLAPSSKISTASSQTQTVICQDALVEIYKNSVANAESESGLEMMGKNKLLKPNESFRQLVGNKISNDKSPNGEEIKTKSCNYLNSNAEKALGEQMQQIFSDLNKSPTQEKQNDSMEYLNEGNTQKTETFGFETSKNYSKPTISSKRKQIARDIYSNLNNLEIRHLPFVAARSTAPSHNIGVNIQQVLSIIKKRHPINENLLSITENGNQENPMLAMVSSRKIGMKTNGTSSAPVTGIPDSWDRKPATERPKTSSMSYWKSNSEVIKRSSVTNDTLETSNDDWHLKVEKLKKVLVFLHEDFTSLSRKYKRLQKKLTKRNITKTDAKNELDIIERNLEKKEEEITVVIVLYREVMNLKEDLKKLQDKYNLVTSGRNILGDGFRHSSSAHTQMTNLLRKIQDFQTKLKG